MPRSPLTHTHARLRGRRRGRGGARGERHYAALTAGLRDALVVVAADGRIVEVNPSACEMLGYAEEELVGMPAPHAPWAGEEHDGLAAALRESEADGGGRFEVTLRRRGAERFPAVADVVSVDEPPTG